MKTIIAGSRNSTREAFLQALKRCPFVKDITEVVCGGARGADTFGEEWAIKNNVPVRKFLPDWDKHGKFAGILRNRQMADYAEALIAIWDGVSPGTLNMIREATSRGLKVFVFHTYDWDS